MSSGEARDFVPRTEGNCAEFGTVSFSKASRTELGPAEEAAVHGGTPTETVAPDGGPSAWLVVSGVWCASFCTFGWVNSIGSFQDFYQNNLLKNYSTSAVAWIPSLQIFFMNALGPLIGTIYDNYGPKQLMLVGTFLHVFGLMMTSLATEYYSILLTQGVCSAVGVACISQPSLSTINTWFNLKRGTAYGVLSTGSSIGGVIFPIMISRLVPQVGFPWTMRICGFIIMCLLTVANLTVENFKSPKPQKVNMRYMVRPLREPPFALLLAGLFLFTYGLYVPVNYLPVQLLNAGVSQQLAENIIPVFNASSLFGRLFSGVVGDRIGRFNIFIIVCYLSGVWALAVWIPSHAAAGLIAFAVLFGFCSGSYVSLMAALIAQISPANEIGLRTGIIYLAASIGGLTTNPINGAIFDEPNGEVGIKVFSGVFCIVSATFITAARVYHTGFSLFVNF
ncbi:major facilitator superfamily transporter [Colletotrichum incanum]|nr:major facilitator superfamily transporter [Colletotrichum incanum]